MRRDAHTYRHDLESFLYLLLRLIVCNRKGLPPGSRLVRWDFADYEQSANAKEEDMASDKFELLLDEWDVQYRGVKKLACTLRALLFRKETTLFLGTDLSVKGTNRLYSDFIISFNQAI